MPVDLTETRVIGVSSRALFDLEHENRIFEEQGLEAYRAFQLQHEGAPPRRGTAFHLVEAIRKLNDAQEPVQPPLVEVVILSRNDAAIGLRIFNAVKEHGLEGKVTRPAFTRGAGRAGYLATCRPRPTVRPECAVGRGHSLMD